jgi:predicted nucleic acid-binding protein
MEMKLSSETSFLARVAQHNIPIVGILGVFIVAKTVDLIFQCEFIVLEE